MAVSKIMYNRIQNRTVSATKQQVTKRNRVQLFVLVRILFQYLAKVDPSTLLLAKEILKDCERKHGSKDCKYSSLADAIDERLRCAVGEAHWTRACKIQKQLMLVNQQRKMKAMQEIILTRAVSP